MGSVRGRFGCGWSASMCSSFSASLSPLLSIISSSGMVNRSFRVLTLLAVPQQRQMRVSRHSDADGCSSTRQPNDDSDSAGGEEEEEEEEEEVDVASAEEVSCKELAFSLRCEGGVGMRRV